MKRTEILDAMPEELRAIVGTDLTDPTVILLVDFVDTLIEGQQERAVEEAIEGYVCEEWHAEDVIGDIEGILASAKSLDGLKDDLRNLCAHYQ
jgi:hypothetical protein